MSVEMNEAFHGPARSTNEAALILKALKSIKYDQKLYISAFRLHQASFLAFLIGFWRVIRLSGYVPLPS